MGSVKSLKLLEPALPEKLGKGVFVFSDDYSVFDWGKMPDTIPGKGETLAIMGAFNFELLEKKGVQTHYIGMTENFLKLKEMSVPSNVMGVKLTTVPELPFSKGKYLYDDYFKKAGKNFLVPLEIIYRNRVPVGSSIRKRFKPIELGLDYDEWPNKNIELKKPLYDFSTKLEEFDRYLSRQDALIVSGLKKQKFFELKEVAEKVNKIVSRQAKKTGFLNEDGKIEVFFYDNELYVCDVVGTFDENRFSFKGLEVSKEIARQYYLRKQFDWVDSITKAKKDAKTKNLKEWKQLCKKNPEKLDSEFKKLFSQAYLAGANQYTGKKWFDAPKLGSVLKKLKEKGFI